MQNIQVLCDYKGVFVFVHFTEDNGLNLVYKIADTYEQHTTLTADATKKLCTIYKCDMNHLLEKIKEEFVTEEDLITLSLYGEVTLDWRFQRFCDDNHLEYKTYTLTDDNNDFDVNLYVEEVETEQSSKMVNEQFEEFIDAVANKDKTKLRAMIKKGFDVNMANEDGRTALMMAVQVGDLNILKMLIKAGANLEQRAKEDETAFLYACRVTENVKVIEYLIKQGANTKTKNVFGNNALFMAAEHNKNWEVVEYLINTKLYDINDQNCSYNYTPLMAAVRYNTIDVVNVLIDHGANIYAKDADGWLPVLHATANYDDNPMNLIRLIGLDPRLFTFKVGKNNLRQISEDNHNLNIRLVLDSILSIYMFFSKTPSKGMPN